MLDYQCVTEKAVASSRRRNSSSKADTRNLFSCADVGVHTSDRALPNPMILSRHLSRQLCQYATYISWQAIKSPDSLQLSIIMTCTLTNINDFS